MLLYTKKRLSRESGQPEFRCSCRRQNAYALSRALSAFSFLQASCANVTGRFFTVINVGNFLYVYFERSSRFAVRVAYVVTGRLTFTADIAYSRHMTPPIEIILSCSYYPFCLRIYCFVKTSINTISSI